MIRKKFKIKLKIVIPSIIIFICLIGVIVSSIDIIKWKIDSDKTDSQTKVIQDFINIIEIDNSDKTEIILPKGEVDLSNPYWDYIEMKLIDVDFDELKKMNPDTKGWIKVNGTNINYPFVQSSDNKYYLKRSFDKSYNSAGWVFLDYRNSIEPLNKNTILYAHGRVDTTMFGSLKNTLKNDWLNNTDNHVIKLSTDYDNTLWQIFSIYHIPTTNDYIQVHFSSDLEFVNWTNTLISRSSHNFNTDVSATDNILTLSTCYNEEEKLVVHAKLIKRKTK